MTIILNGWSRIENYLDHIIIHRRDMSMHDEVLQSILKHHEAAGLLLNKDKCFFRQTSLLFFGHIVSATSLFFFILFFFIDGSGSDGGPVPRHDHNTSLNCQQRLTLLD